MKHQYTEIREVRVSYNPTTTERFQVKEPRKVADFVRSVLPDNSREHFVVLYLDGSHRVISYSVLFTGLANYCPVHPREVFQRAIVSGACALVVAHNHPSGDPTPSTDDWSTTEKMQDAGKLLGIKLLDHIVVTDSAYKSLAASSQWSRV